MQSHVVIPCNIRNNNFQSEKAVSYKDVSNLIINMIETGDNMSVSSVTLRPANS